MIRIYILLAAASLSFFKLFAQDNKEGLTKSDFKTVINKQFSSLVTGQSKSSIGNFASLDLQETEVSFAGASITKKGHVFGVRAAGGVNDGLFSIFNNSSFSKKASLEFQANFLNLNKQSLTWENESFQVFTKKRKALKDSYNIKLIKAEAKSELLTLTYQKNKLETNIKQLQESIKNTSDALTRDSIFLAIKLAVFELSEVTKSIENYQFDLRIIKEELNNWYATELNKLKPELDVYGFNFGWLSVFYKISNNSFKLFNPTASFSGQISDTSYTSHELKIQYSRYNWTLIPFRTFFYDVGISFSLTDNFSELQKIEIADVVNFGPNLNDRSVTRKFDAYTGSFLSKQKKFKIYADYYHFLFENNVAALHIYPETNFADQSKPIYNLGLGFLYAFKDAKKDDRSVVNAELYYNFLDISKNTETSLKLLERNNIGIRFTFPIIFINK